MKFLIPLLVAAAMFAQPANPSLPVREVIQKYIQARETRDAKALAALFTEDADQLVSDGVWRKGREALVKGTLESSNSNDAHRTIEVQTVRLLTPRIAIADGRYTLGKRVMWTTIILTRDGGGAWLIAGIRNMLPALQTPAK